MKDLLKDYLIILVGIILFSILGLFLLILLIVSISKPSEDIELGGIKTFDSCKDLSNFAESRRRDYPVYYDFPIEDAISETTGGFDGAESVSNSFTDTNIQVEGVNESDIIKTDGEFMYVVNQDYQPELSIFNVSNPKDVSLVSTTELDNYSPTEMYLVEDQLIIFNTTENYYDGYEEFVLNAYDVKDKQNIQLRDTLKIDASNVTTRLVDNTIYLVNRKSAEIFYPENYTQEQILSSFPTIKSNNESVNFDCEDVSFIGDSINYYTVISSYNIDNGSIDGKLLLGNINEVFSSTNNLYLTTAITEYLDQGEDEFSVGNLDVLPEPIETNIYTEIFRIGFDNGDLEFKANGRVEGTLLNRYSMDEFGGNLRIATTLNQFRGGQSNNVTILDLNLEEVGKIENIAPGERIFSARYYGDIAYLVTFRQVDPFYIIDLSNPEDPKITGEVKLPGFSDYLHRIDEDTVLGIGQSAGRFNGVKLSLFDVSDLKNPKVLDEFVLEESSYSEISTNPKAFTYNSETGNFVVPAQDLRGSEKFYLFNIENNNINLRNTFEVDDDLSKYIQDSFYYPNNHRSVFINEVLFLLNGNGLNTFDSNTFENYSNFIL